MPIFPSIPARVEISPARLSFPKIARDAPTIRSAGAEEYRGGPAAAAAPPESIAAETETERRRKLDPGRQAEQDTSSGAAADPAAPARARRRLPPCIPAQARQAETQPSPGGISRGYPRRAPSYIETRRPASAPRLPLPPASRHYLPIRPNYPRIPRAQPSRPASMPIILYILSYIALYLHLRIPYRDRPPERMPALHPLPRTASRLYRPPPLDPLPPIL